MKTLVKALMVLPFFAFEEGQVETILKEKTTYEELGVEDGGVLSGLVLWGGECGRTPVAQDGNGRDHN